MNKGERLMNIKMLWHRLCRYRSITGYFLLLTGALLALANEFVMQAGELSIAGIGGDPSTIGLTLIICGLVISQRRRCGLPSR
jgi:hypothetical protein